MQIHELVHNADKAYQQGAVETPVDYVEKHINECDNPEVAWMQIQRIYESRAYRG